MEVVTVGSGAPAGPVSRACGGRESCGPPRAGRSASRDGAGWTTGGAAYTHSGPTDCYHEASGSWTERVVLASGTVPTEYPTGPRGPLARESIRSRPHRARLLERTRRPEHERAAGESAREAPGGGARAARGRL